MKKNSMIKVAAGAAALLLMTTSAQAGYAMKKKVGGVDTKLVLFGFSQLEARTGEGAVGKDSNQKVAFGAQRIRLGWKYFAGNVAGKVFLDWNQFSKTDGIAENLATGEGSAMPKVIKDAFISYKFDDALVVKLGLIKMPNGMSFTMPGWNLDNVERGFDKHLALERNTGIMLSGRDMGMGNNGKVNGLEMGHERPWKGFGYDIMMANQADRSPSVKAGKNGGNSYAVRGMFDNTETLHLEASYAVSENADGKDKTATNGISYKNINVGVDSNLGKLSLKAEAFKASNIKGVDGSDMTTVSATAGYFVTPQLEAVVKHIDASHDLAGVSTDLRNTYLGLNIFISMPYEDFSRKAKRMRNQHKVVLNYIVAGGNTDDWKTNTGGFKGHVADSFVAQYQFKF